MLSPTIGCPAARLRDWMPFACDAGPSAGPLWAVEEQLSRLHPHPTMPIHPSPQRGLLPPKLWPARRTQDETGPQVTTVPTTACPPQLPRTRLLEPRSPRETGRHPRVGLGQKRPPYQQSQRFAYPCHCRPSLVATGGAQPDFGPRGSAAARTTSHRVPYTRI